MKKVFVLLLLFSACTSRSDKSAPAAAAIFAADKAMDSLAAQKGFYNALLDYADDNVILPKEGELPVIGKKLLAKYWKDKPLMKELRWVPVRAEASASGDMGYTFGNWTFTSADTVMYGNYCTVWKIQADKTWKFVYDGGNNTPKP